MSTNFFARLFFLHDDTRSPPRGLQRMLVIFLNNRKKLKLSNCTSYSGHFCVPIAEFRNLHVFFIRSSSLQYRNKILQFKFLALSTHFSKLNSEILTLLQHFKFLHRTKSFTHPNHLRQSIIS